MNNKRTQKMTAWMLVLILFLGMFASDATAISGIWAVKAAAEESAEPAVVQEAEPAPAPAAEEPKPEPKEAPAEEPKEEPKEEPTEAPTAEPTEAPTEVATEAPTAEPTEEPTEEPTAEPAADPLLVTVSASTAAVRVGQHAEFSISVTGGTPEYSIRCTVAHNGAVVHEEQLSATAFGYTPLEAGEYIISFYAVDAAGEMAATDAKLTAADGLIAELETAQKYAFVGRLDINARVTIANGAAPYTCVERVYCDGTLESEVSKEIAEQGTFDYTYAPLKHGEYKIVMEITDATGETAKAELKLPVAEEDPENSEGWEAKARVTLSGDWHEDLVKVAATQIGYRESDIDFIIDENDERHFYTMYGDWYGCPYDEWCAMFVSWCLDHAGIEQKDFPRAASCERWKDALKSVDAYESDTSAYTPKVGDLVFFNWDGGNKAQHIGIVAEVGGSSITTIEGNSGRAVTRDGYSRNDGSIIGYGNVDTLMIRAGLLEAEDDTAEVELIDEATGVRVILSNAALPEGITADALTLSVQSVPKEAEEVVEAMSRIDEYIVVETVYDIKLLLTESGEEIQPVGEVRVVFPTTEETEGVKDVYHVHGGGDISKMGLEDRELRVDGFSLFLLSSSSTYGIEDPKYTHLAWKTSSSDDRAIRLWPKDADPSSGQVVYCYNRGKAWPENNLDINGNPRTVAEAAVPYWKTGDLSAANFKSNMATPRSGLSAEELRSKVISAVANGYPRNASGILDKYPSLSSEALCTITQYAVWYYTDSAPMFNSWVFPSGTNWNDAVALYNELIHTDLEVDENYTRGIDLYNTDTISEAEEFFGKPFQSLLSITSSFNPKEQEPELGDLDIIKTVTGDNVDTNKEFTFTITAWGKDGTLIDAEFNATKARVPMTAEFENGVFTTTLKHGEALHIEGLPVDAEFKVTESDAEGYTTIINGTESADRTWAGQMVDNGNGFHAVVNVENAEIKTSSLYLRKVVSGPFADEQKDFTFTIVARDANGNLLNGTYPTKKWNVTLDIFQEDAEDGILTFTNGVCTTTLKHGDELEINGLPYGANSYVVTESDAEGYITYFDGEVRDDRKAEVTANAAEDYYTTMVFVNVDPRPAGTLRVQKTVTGADADTQKEFTFTISGNDKDNNPINGDFEMRVYDDITDTDNVEIQTITFVNGECTVSLKHNQRIEIKTLPADGTYKVVESDAADYVTLINGNENASKTWEGQMATVIRPGKQGEAIFYEADVFYENSLRTSFLRISKTVNGVMGNKDKEFTFTVVGVDGNDAPVNGTFATKKWNTEAGQDAATATAGTATFVDGTFTTTLKHGDVLDIEGVHLDYVFTVTETDADGYVTEVNGTLKENRDITASYLAKIDGFIPCAFVNTMDAVVPTGVILAVWPYLLATLLAVGALLLLFVFRKKK